MSGPYDRFLRSFPVVGVLIGLASLPGRLAQERAEDAAYREAIEALGEVPKYPHASEHQARWTIAGELTTHLGALGLGLGTSAWFALEPIPVVVATWLAAYVGDWAAHAIVRRVGSRRADDE